MQFFGVCGGARVGLAWPPFRGKMKVSTHLESRFPTEIRMTNTPSPLSVPADAGNTAVASATQRLTVEVGRDTPCYAEFTIEAPADATPDQIKAIAIEQAWERDGDLVYDPSWDWEESLRITSVRTEAHDIILSDIPLELNYHDLGRVAHDYLMGAIGFDALAAEAKRQGWEVKRPRPVEPTTNDADSANQEAP